MLMVLVDAQLAVWMEARVKKDHDKFLLVSWPGKSPKRQYAGFAVYQLHIFV